MKKIEEEIVEELLQKIEISLNRKEIEEEEKQYLSSNYEELVKFLKTSFKRKINKIWFAL